MSAVAVTPIPMQSIAIQLSSEAESVRAIGDALRGTLVANKLEQIPRLLQKINELIKDAGGDSWDKNFWGDPKPLSLGYVGFHKRMRIPIPPKKNQAGEPQKKKFILMELQIHIKQIMDGTDDCAKEITHRLYKIPEEVAKETDSSDVISSAKLIFLTSMVKLLYPTEELQRITNLLDVIQAATKADKKMRLTLEPAVLLQNERLCLGEWNEKLQAVVPLDGDAVAAAWMETAKKINDILNLPVVEMDKNKPWTNTATTVDELYADAHEMAPFFKKMCETAVEGEPGCYPNFGPGGDFMIKKRESLQEKISKKGQLPMKSPAHNEAEHKLSNSEAEHKLSALDKHQKAPQAEVFKPKKTLACYYPRLQKKMVDAISLKQQHPSFIGRQTELQAMAAALGTHKTVTLWGPGGIGKTEIAITFANQRLESYSLVWFFPCSTEEGKLTAYIELATILSVPFQPTQLIEDLFRNVHLKLENIKDKPWLLIYDDVPCDPQSPLHYPARGGHTLITSYAKNPNMHSIQIQPFPIIEAEQLMSHLTHEPPSPAMRQLIELCGHYPFILERVGMDISRTPGASIQSHLEELLKDTDLNQLPTQERYNKTFERAMLQTFKSLSIPALKWLQACNYLHHNSIPLSYLHRWLELQEKEATTHRFQKDMLTTLSEHAIQQLEEGLLAMPRLFHWGLSLIQEGADIPLPVIQQILAEDAIKWSTLMKTKWQLAMKQASIWNEHALHFLKKPDFTALSLEKQAVIFHFLGILKEAQSELNAALAYHQRALQLREQTGVHTDVATSLNSVGDCYYRLNQRDQAAMYHKRADECRQGAGEEKPLDLANSLIHRAGTCYSQGKQQEALDLSTQALSIQVRELGEQSIEVAGTWFSIGQCEEALGSNSKALVCYKKAHTIAQKCSGNDHPLTKKSAFHSQRLEKLVKETSQKEKK